MDDDDKVRDCGAPGQVISFVSNILILVDGECHKEPGSVRRGEERVTRRMTKTRYNLEGD